MRTIINQDLEQYKNNKVALLFSGGMDSLSLLLSCLDVGIKPHLYTFKLCDYDSEDYKFSIKISKIFDLKLTVINISNDIDLLLKDVEYIIKKFKVKKKTQIQCIHPFVYVIEHITEKYVLTGLCADELYGTPRKMQELGRKDLNEFNKKRLEVHSDLKSSSYIYIKQLFEEKNIKLIAPYKENNELVEYMMNKTFKELHSPKQKNVMYENYKNELNTYKLYRRNSNLQCNSKIRELHDKLLNTFLNVDNNKSVVAIYNRLYKKIWSEN